MCLCSHSQSRTVRLCLTVLNRLLLATVDGAAAATVDTAQPAVVVLQTVLGEQYTNVLIDACVTRLAARTNVGEQRLAVVRLLTTIMDTQPTMAERVFAVEWTSQANEKMETLVDLFIQMTSEEVSLSFCAHAYVRIRADTHTHCVGRVFAASTRVATGHARKRVAPMPGVGSKQQTVVDAACTIASVIAGTF